MLGGRIRFDVPMLCCIAFLIQFLVAGLTGISHASVALDWQTKNSYFLVAHFHFVAVGAIVFACADLGTARTVGDFYWLDLVSRVIDTFTSGWLRQSIGVCGRCLGIA